MLFPGTQGWWQDALTRPHTPIFRVDVVDPATGAVLLRDLPYSTGDVKCTLTSQVARRGDLNVARELFPQGPDDLLAPYGNDLHIYRGIRLGNGAEYLVRVFTGRINKVTRKPRTLTKVEFVDRGGDIADAQFETPVASQVGVNVVTEFERLISDGYPAATFGAHDLIGYAVPALVWDDDRSKACDDLAEGGGALWYPLANGDFVMRRTPWTVAPGPPVALYADGARGRVTDSALIASREGVASAAVVEAERADGTEPARFVSRDMDPTSPTYYLGKFGRKVVKLSLSTPSTDGQARVASQNLLAISRALTDAWDLEAVPDPALELGDVVTVACDARPPSLQCVAEFNIPLTVDGKSAVKTRAIVEVESL